MRNLTVKEIVNYAKDIEKGSFAFYTQALKNASENSIELLQELAAEEEKHYNLLDNLLQNNTEGFDVVLSLDETILDRASGATISEGATEREILEIAAQRELDTKKLYDMYLTFSELPSYIIELFESLSNQEQGHYNIIRSKIKALS